MQAVWCSYRAAQRRSHACAFCRQVWRAAAAGAVAYSRATNARLPSATVEMMSFRIGVLHFSEMVWGTYERAGRRYSAVVGSITERTRAMAPAGNPPRAAWVRTVLASGAT